MRIETYILPILIILILVLSGCTNFQYTTFDHNGVTRYYILHLPDDLPKQAPLVFVLHGYTSNAQQMITYTDMNQVADENGFAVCYPQGTEDYKDTTHWNARFSISTTDDIGFLSSLAVYLQDEYDLDSNRTFSCGHSNGGFMSYTLACEAPDIFKAIASVAGTMSGYTWDHRDIAEPIPVLHIHSIDDEVVPIDGSMSEEGGWGGAPPVDTIIEFWVDLNNCTKIEQESISENTNAFYFMNNISLNQVWYYKIDNWDHSWPKNKLLKSYCNPGIDASEVIWEFFGNY